MTTDTTERALKSCIERFLTGDAGTSPSENLRSSVS